MTYKQNYILEILEQAGWSRTSIVKRHASVPMNSAFNSMEEITLENLMHMVHFGLPLLNRTFEENMHVADRIRFLKELFKHKIHVLTGKDPYLFEEEYYNITNELTSLFLLYSDISAKGWIKTKDYLPIPKGKEKTVQCLIKRGRGIEMAFWDTYHMCWNDYQDDDHLCDKDSVTEWKYVE